MNLERLGMFVRVVELGSVRAAAAAVHLTQPAVSRNLKLLEDEVGASLFSREGRKLALTAAGRALIPRARELLELAEQAGREVSRTAERDYFDLRLGTVDSVGTVLLPQVLADVRSCFPELVLRLNTARTATLLERVARDEIDVAVVANSGAPDGVNATPVGRYALRYWGRRDRFPALSSVTKPSELRDYPVVEIEPPPGTPSAEPAELMSYARASNVATVKAMVMAGFGVGDFVDFMLTPAERRKLVPAGIPHDPECKLFVVSAPGWRGEAQSRIREALCHALTRRLSNHRQRA